MNWVRNKILVFNLMVFLSFALLSQTPTSLAQEQKNIEDWEIKITNFISNKEYDEAFELLNQLNLEENPEALQIRGHLLGSGALSSGKNLCAAILDLEKAYQKLIYLRGSLDNLYAGDWASIAAIEGNPRALYWVGERIIKNNSPSNWFYIYNDQIVVKNAYVYFYNSALLGDEWAKQKLTRIEQKYPSIDFSKNKIKMEFKEIYCPVRDVAK